MRMKVVMARVVCGSCLPLILVPAVNMAKFGRTREPQDTPPHKVDAKLVTVPITVTDRQGRTIGGLSKQDFRSMRILAALVNAGLRAIQDSAGSFKSADAPGGISRLSSECRRNVVAAGSFR